ncbi:translation initiation factor IF-2 [Macrococcoides goetzii]|uniref:Translation initiation factor IF-2 n=1 Tax=Macrococcoides goetzii TaxID=1891097 RepID=A0A2G5NS44_9STAP|nr:translation initiation factor IF-2 [Macrococcus goetzii]RAI82800.1 translation initiation factor IF-2 [Macrococcus goetzii]TDM42213.1 translation initiation factor IF-2 [Macrococcus goetzii]TDM47840.1 translation initiation factor IF-2 [Macrococcus goetzii]TDM51066.1 translation initiation factor IF-2 [Macrococcus goetzii]
MIKKRIYEYAKEVKLKSKDIIDELKKMNIEVTSHMQVIEDKEITALDKIFKKDQVKTEQKTENKPAEKAEPKKEQPKQETKPAAKPADKPANKPAQKPRHNNNHRPGSNNKPGTGGPNRNKKGKGKGNPKPAPVIQEPVVKETPSKITYEEGITVGELAEKLNKDASEIVKNLFMVGIMANINQSLNQDAIELICDEYGVEAELEVVVDATDLETYFEDVDANPEDIIERPSVVTIMGHVDHGKTTLLDSIRNTRVTAGEAGGITQHIGAYQIENEGKKITFLDTPGHAAFTTMRARGAQVTDITILVVAADDGVMPQTVEAINHAKAAEVPIIVAVNKIDKPTANPDRVMQELGEHGLYPEDWGGDTIFVQLSAIKGDGIDELLEMILLVSEVAELKANPKRTAIGTVIEAELDKSRGPAASLLVQDGTLEIGDSIVVGNTFGRVRAMVNDLGKRIKSAGPSTPVEITGLQDVPLAGDRFVVFKDEKRARRIGEARQQQNILAQRQESQKVSLDNLFEQIKQGEMKDLNVIIKGDVQGSVEALAASLMKIDVEGVNVRIIHTAVGAINESDVTLASASNGIIIGFNVRPDVNAKRAAEAEGVDMRLHRIIYKVIEEIEQAMIGMLDPEYEEKVIGQAEVRQTINISKVGTVAGSYVTEGKITRDSQVRIIRDGIVVYEGQVDALKRFKDDVREVAQGYECGITIENFNDVKEGDIFEAFIMEEIKRK